jgi:hypothetical protein
MLVHDIFLKVRLIFVGKDTSLPMKKVTKKYFTQFKYWLSLKKYDVYTILV